MDVRAVADWTVRPRLLAVPGVSQVVPIGGEVKQYQVLVSPDRLSAYGVTLLDVLHAAECDRSLLNMLAMPALFLHYGVERPGRIVT